MTDDVFLVFLQEMNTNINAVLHTRDQLTMMREALATLPVDISTSLYTTIKTEYDAALVALQGLSAQIGT